MGTTMHDRQIRQNLTRAVDDALSAMRSLHADETAERSDVAAMHTALTDAAHALEMGAQPFIFATSANVECDEAARMRFARRFYRAELRDELV